MGGRGKVAKFVGVLAVVAFGSGCATSDSGLQTTEAGPSPTKQSPAGVKVDRADERAGRLPDGDSSRCVEEYRPPRIASRAFAFDGTVTDIAALDGSDELGSMYVSVTFAVNEWFHGSEAGTVTVDVVSPQAAAHQTSVSGGSYEVGSRLLVSGEPRWGGHALDNAVAWNCGFTRYHDEVTADAWRTASN